MNPSFTTLVKNLANDGLQWSLNMLRSTGLRIGGFFTPVVKKLMIINGAVFLLQQLMGYITPGLIEHTFGLNHHGLVYEFKLWQIITYMFLHGGWMHIIFNLLGLWMFAGELELLWGGRQFLKYYLFTGVGAGIFIALMNFFIASTYGENDLMPYSPTTIGASGAIYGILLAYGLIWPNREVLLYFIVPIKMKYLLLFYGAMEFFGTISINTTENVSHIGHLGGLFSGFIYLYIQGKQRRSGTPSPARKRGFISEFFKQYRLKRKKREIAERIKAKKIIDNLLEKIAKGGMGSLSSEEKRQLEWARQHYYPEKNEVIH
jgi:membrane associated rhomboid family serine protease